MLLSRRNSNDALKASNCVKYNSDNHRQKQLRHSPKKTCFVKHASFSISIFHILTPSPLFNVVTTWQCQASIFQHSKGGERGLAINKKDIVWNYFFYEYILLWIALLTVYYNPIYENKKGKQLLITTVVSIILQRTLKQLLALINNMMQYEMLLTKLHYNLHNLLHKAVQLLIQFTILVTMYM